MPGKFQEALHALEIKNTGDAIMVMQLALSYPEQCSQWLRDIGEWPIGREDARKYDAAVVLFGSESEYDHQHVCCGVANGWLRGLLDERVISGGDSQ